MLGRHVRRRWNYWKLPHATLVVNVHLRQARQGNGLHTRRFYTFITQVTFGDRCYGENCSSTVYTPIMRPIHSLIYLHLPPPLVVTPPCIHVIAAPFQTQERSEIMSVDRKINLPSLSLGSTSRTLPSPAKPSLRVDTEAPTPRSRKRIKALRYVKCHLSIIVATVLYSYAPI